MTKTDKIEDGISDSFYEKYPFWIVMLSNLVSVGIYVIGAYIMFRAHIAGLILYLLYVVFLELRLLRKSCALCYYYGKTCAFGKGKLACLFVKKGDPGEFNRKQVTWKDIVPDLLVTVVPVITGIVLLIINFNWVILGLMIIILLLGSAGSGYIRGKLACKYCKQRELGCPAERLFNKDRAQAAGQ